MAVLKANGSILKANGKILVKSGGGDFVEVGGIQYPYKKIGRRYWTTVSLRNMTEHAIMPESGVPDDGMLYQYYYVHREIIPLLPAGWRIPTQTDFFHLAFDFSSGAHYPAAPYIAVDKGGTDLSGLNLKLIGYISYEGVYSYTNQRSVVWSQTTRPYGSPPSKYCGRFVLNDTYTFDNVSYGTEDNLETSAMEVRICKDA
jgi:uncharacterized protein (TIGR02145 family)